SDFVRSVLDMFAYGREVDDSIVLAAGLPSRWFEGQGVSIADLRTPHGRLGYSLRRSDRQLILEVPAGITAPAGGLVLPWPYAGKPGDAKVNGESVEWVDGELRIHAVPARVEIEVPSSVRRAERKN
ncbi:MAG TPA: coagulation factor 5/8 type domain-containing protein, partial [Stenotrophomonas sp.]